MLRILCQNFINNSTGRLIFFIHGFHRWNFGLEAGGHFFDNGLQCSQLCMGKPFYPGCLAMQSLQLFFAQASPLLILFIQTDNKR